jgi:hypothetical protein
MKTKKRYSSPQLTRLGNVSELTLSAVGKPNFDGTMIPNRGTS